MQKEKLNSTDRSKIRHEVKQTLISFALVGVVVATVTTAVVLFLLMKQQPGIVVFSTVLVAITGFMGFLYYSIKDHLKDLLDGAKYTYEAHVMAKAAKTNWGWHGNPAADAASQPHLSIYTLSIDEQKINVGEEIYNSFAVGDKVWVHITPNSELILELSKKHQQV